MNTKTQMLDAEIALLTAQIARFEALAEQNLLNGNMAEDEFYRDIATRLGRTLRLLELDRESSLEAPATVAQPVQYEVVGEGHENVTADYATVLAWTNELATEWGVEVAERAGRIYIGSQLFAKQR